MNELQEEIRERFIELKKEMIDTNKTLLEYATDYQEFLDNIDFIASDYRNGNGYYGLTRHNALNHFEDILEQFNSIKRTRSRHLKTPFAYLLWVDSITQCNIEETLSNNNLSELEMLADALNDFTITYEKYSTSVFHTALEVLKAVKYVNKEGKRFDDGEISESFLEYVRDVNKVMTAIIQGIEMSMDYKKAMKSVNEKLADYIFYDN